MLESTVVEAAQGSIECSRCSYPACLFSLESKVAIWSLGIGLCGLCEPLLAHTTVMIVWCRYVRKVLSTTLLGVCWTWRDCYGWMMLHLQRCCWKKICVKEYLPVMTKVVKRWVLFSQAVWLRFGSTLWTSPYQWILWSLMCGGAPLSSPYSPALNSEESFLLRSSFLSLKSLWRLIGTVC